MNIFKIKFLEKSLFFCLASFLCFQCTPQINNFKNFVSVEKAEAIYSSRCVVCHGASGRGDGPAAKYLLLKPHNLADAKWQASVNDAFLEVVIKYGGTGIGEGPSMPGNPDLVLGKNVEVLRALIAKVRSLANTTTTPKDTTPTTTCKKPVDETKKKKKKKKNIEKSFLQ